jgi:acetyltransferase
MATYPAELAREHRLVDGRSVLIRPVRADDEPAEQRFFGALSSESRRKRFLKYVRAVSDQLTYSFTHIDYENHMAFVCESGGELVGEARYVVEGEACEFSIVIADRWHKTGIAGLLMDALIDHARAHGVRTMEGLVLRDNHTMLAFVRSLGFEVEAIDEDARIVRVAKRLGEVAAA